MLFLGEAGANRGPKIEHTKWTMHVSLPLLYIAVRAPGAHAAAPLSWLHKKHLSLLCLPRSRSEASNQEDDGVCFV